MTNKASHRNCARGTTWLRGLVLTTLLGLLPMLAQSSETGVKVHGDWEIVIHDPDGTLTRRAQFKNSLLASGERALFSVLTGIARVSQRSDGSPAWSIWVQGDGVLSRNEDNSGLGCALKVGNVVSTSIDDNPQAAELSPIETFPPSTNVTGAFTLTRTLSVPEACLTGDSYSITGVDTLVGMQTAYPDDLILERSFSFSRKTLGDDSVTGILPDQVVTLKVTYSFE